VQPQLYLDGGRLHGTLFGSHWGSGNASQEQDEDMLEFDAMVGDAGVSESLDLLKAFRMAQRVLSST